MAYDSDKAVPRVSRMWWKLGLALEKVALEKSANTHNSPTTSMAYARAAEVCFFQATGEMDAVLMSELFPKNRDAA